MLKRAWLEKKRRERLTQEDAGHALDMSPSGFSQYIGGKIPIGLEAAIKLCEYLGVPLSEAGFDVVQPRPIRLVPKLKKAEAGELDQRMQFERLLSSLSDDELRGFLKLAISVLSPLEQLEFSEHLIAQARKNLPKD